MTNKTADIAAIVAAVIAAMGTAKPAKSAKKYPAVKPYKAYAPKLVAPPEDRRQAAQAKRLSSIGRGFAAKGIKVTFDKESGRFDNVKPFKLWLSEGLIVRKGQTGVKGFFHVSQCEKYVAPALPSTGNVAVKVLPPQTREHFEAQMSA